MKESENINFYTSKTTEILTKFVKTKEVLTSSLFQFLKLKSVTNVRFLLAGIEATMVQWSEHQTLNLVCITGVWGSSPYHGGVLTQHLDINSGKIAVFSDYAIYNVPQIVHRLSCRKKLLSQTANKNVHTCNHDDQVPLSFLDVHSYQNQWLFRSNYEVVTNSGSG